MTIFNVFILILAVIAIEVLLFFWFAQGFLRGFLKDYLELDNRVQFIENHLML